MGELTAALRERATAFDGVLKLGRTQLQEAVPLTMGQEFTAFATALAAQVGRIAALRSDLAIVHLGGRPSVPA